MLSRHNDQDYFEEYSKKKKRTPLCASPESLLIPSDPNDVLSTTLLDMQSDSFCWRWVQLFTVVRFSGFRFSSSVSFDLLLMLCNSFLRPFLGKLFENIGLSPFFLSFFAAVFAVIVELRSLLSFPIFCIYSLIGGHMLDWFFIWSHYINTIEADLCRLPATNYFYQFPPLFLPTWYFGNEYDRWPNMTYYS